MTKKIQLTGVQADLFKAGTNIACLAFLLAGVKEVVDDIGIQDVTVAYNKLCDIISEESTILSNTFEHIPTDGDK